MSGGSYDLGRFLFHCVVCLLLLHHSVRSQNPSHVGLYTKQVLQASLSLAHRTTIGCGASLLILYWLSSTSVRQFVQIVADMT